MFAFTLALVAVMATAGNAGKLVALTLKDKQGLLDAHNLLRAQTALGRTPNQPEAANMHALEWDDRLEASAGTWVSQCVAGHDNKADRALPGYEWVGQNWAGGSYTNLSYYVTLWFDEYTLYTFDSKYCSGVCGHYTQVVWANTTLVGCAAASCSDMTNLVCNYAFAGNFNNEFPYVKGTAGSQCIGDYSLKQKGLCLRRDQCTGSDCVCTLTSCVNGQLDTANCKCVCPAGYYGDKCEKACKDDPNYASYCSQYNCQYTNYYEGCTKTCNNCKSSSISRDPNVVNKVGVKTRLP